MKRLYVITILMLAILTVPLANSDAHEFIIKPVQMNVEPGAKLPFSVVSAHVFMVSEEMEPLDKVAITSLDASGQTKIKLTSNETLMTLDGCVEPKNAGTLVLAGHRQGVIWTNTTEGWKQAGKKGLKGVISSGLYEKFAKAIVNVGEADDGYKKVVGHKLEIVPQTNPALAKSGENMEFQILYDGKPFATEVYATYDGFTDCANSYAYFTETYGKGMAKVKITHPGLWMVRVQHSVNEPNDDYDKHVMRSVLVFKVN